MLADHCVADTLTMPMLDIGMNPIASNPAATNPNNNTLLVFTSSLLLSPFFHSLLKGTNQTNPMKALNEIIELSESLPFNKTIAHT